MNRERDSKPFIAMIGVLQTVFDHDPMPENKVLVYFEYLMDLSLKEIKRAVDEIIRTRKYSTMPTVAEIREAALGMKDDDASAEALRAWDEANRCLISGDRPAPETVEALRLAFGGMAGFGATEPNNEFVMKRFLECYKGGARSERLRGLLDPTKGGGTPPLALPEGGTI
jgi:hypothetical protein